MNPEKEILEKWIERLVDSRSERAAALLSAQPDPFRNPVGYAVRTSLSQLWEQLLGEMDPDIVDAALDAILRIRAVQDISPNESVSFVADLRPLLDQLPSALDRRLIEGRIDRLALAALDKYLQCREEINVVRFHEMERFTRAHRSGAGRVRP